MHCRKVSTNCRKNYALEKIFTLEKILSSWEDYQLSKKFSALEKILSSWKSSQLLRRFSALWKNSQLLKKFSTFENILSRIFSGFEKILSSWGNSPLLRKFSALEKTSCWYQLRFIESFLSIASLFKFVGISFTFFQLYPYLRLNKQ